VTHEIAATFRKSICLSRIIFVRMNVASAGFGPLSPNVGWALKLQVAQHKGTPGLGTRRCATTYAKMYSLRWSWYTVQAAANSCYKTFLNSATRSSEMSWTKVQHTVVVTTQWHCDTVHKQCRHYQTTQTWHRCKPKLRCCAQDCMGKSQVCKRLIDTEGPVRLVLSRAVVDP